MGKTKKMMAGVIGVAAILAFGSCGKERYAAPTGTDCDDWEWDSSTEAYYCDDDDSIRSGGYYYRGTHYSSKDKLKSSSSYKSSYSSGIGTGTKGGFGG